MNTKTTSTRHTFGAIAFLALSLSATAQNTTYDANGITPPIGGNNNSLYGGGGNLLSNTSGIENTSIGFYSMLTNTSGNRNTSVGYGALSSNNADFNCAFGGKALVQNTSGNNNSAYGTESLLMNQTGNNNSALGYHADVSTTGLNNATAIGANAIVNASDRVWIGDVNVKVWTTNAYVVSDGRFKKNVDASQVKGLDFIKLLRPVTYNFDGKGFTEYITKNMSPEARKNHLNRDFSKTYNEIQTGFIAQEVEQAAKTSGYNFSGVHAPDGETDTYGVSYQQFVVPLVKAVQEQQQMIDEQKQMISDLKNLTGQQQQQLVDLQNTLARTSGATGIDALNTNSGLAMSQNEPNPFATETVVKYNVSERTTNAYMAIYDLSGKQINTVAITQKGNSSITLTSEKLAPGIYIYSIIADGKVIDSKRMIVAGK